MLVQRYPTDPLAIDGYRWLLLHQASSEARRRHEMGQFLIVGQTTHGVLGPKMKVGRSTSSPLVPKDPKTPSRRSSRRSTTKTSRDPPTALDLDKPEDIAALVRGGGGAGEEAGRRSARCTSATRPSSSASRRRSASSATSRARSSGTPTSPPSQPEGPWRTAALSELWLAKRAGAVAAPGAGAAGPSEKRPYLDGKLDDDCWQGVKPVKLQNAVGATQKDYPTELRMTHDQDFVYLAVTCGHPAGKTTPPASKRDRDQDLRRHDRVSFVLDLDRDYSTCFHFQIDARGCVAEDCWGDRTWDPRWFVAIHREETAWTAEIAIPRVALTSDHFISGDDVGGERGARAAGPGRAGVLAAGRRAGAGDAAGGDGADDVHAAAGHGGGEGEGGGGAVRGGRADLHRHPLRYNMAEGCVRPIWIGLITRSAAEGNRRNSTMSETTRRRRPSRRGSPGTRRLSRSGSA